MPDSVDDLLARARSRYRRIEAASAAAEREAGALLIDVRPFEIRRLQGEIPGAILVGLNVFEWRLDPQSRWRIPQVRSHGDRVIVVCREGFSSSLAVSRLLDLGLDNSTDVIDGVDGWIAAGLPLEAFDPSLGPDAER